MAGFEPGVEITRELIADNPDAALEHIQALIEQSQQSSSMVGDLQTRLGEAEGTRHELEQRVEKQAIAERHAAEAAGENESLKAQLTDSNAQRTSLLTGADEALRAYRELILQHNPSLPPSLISGGSLNEVNASVEAARGVVEHVQKSIQSSNQSSRLPAGAPMRLTSPDPATMTRNEKRVEEMLSVAKVFLGSPGVLAGPAPKPPSEDSAVSGAALRTSTPAFLPNKPLWP